MYSSCRGALIVYASIVPFLFQPWCLVWITTIRSECLFTSPGFACFFFFLPRSLNVVDQEVGFDQIYGQKGGAKGVQKHRPWPVSIALLTSSLSRF